ncbi:MAG: DUF5996 family protein [Pseudomonadota bacterium]
MPDPAPLTKQFQLPSLPLEEWEDTKNVLHLILQIVGKSRLALHPKLNHWWHVTLYVSPRGLTTGAIPYGAGALSVEVDVFDRALMVRASNGVERGFSMQGLTVAAFYDALMKLMAEIGVDLKILAEPYDNKHDTPFPDNLLGPCDFDHVLRFHQSLTGVASVFETFRGRFLGKSTPVHLFWHSFDLALTRFSGRPAPTMSGKNPSDAEAYSHEVISFGYWAGDDNVREPMFYSYAYPEPADLARTTLSPAAAAWNTDGGSAMALLPYEAVRTASDPKAALLDFLESAYLASAEKAGWDIAALRLDGAYD